MSWEVIWQLEASLALGASALGTALTLAATMSGLAIGSLTVGRLLVGRSVLRPLRLYGLLEATIGISGLLVLPGFAALEWLDSQLYPLAPGLWPGLRLFGILLLLLPATCSMGATIPVFQIIAQRRGPPVSILYGLNTGGAAVGILVFSFLLLPAFGVTRTAAVLASLNGAILALLLWIERGADPEPATQAVGPLDPVRSHIPASPSGEIGFFTAALPIVFATGFATFALEVAWFRSLTAAFRSTTHTFAILLAAVLIPLGTAARLVPWLRQRGLAPRWMLYAAAFAILLTTPLVERMDLYALAVTGPYSIRLLQFLLLSVAVLGPAMLFLGLPLPWCLEEFSDPHRTAWLYAVNTAGSVAGSIMAAWVMLPALGFARTSWMLGSAIVLLALCVLRGPGKARFVAVGAGVASLGIAVLTTSSLGRERVQLRDAFSVARILAYREGADSTVTAIEDDRGFRRLLIDGFSASSESPGVSYMEWMGRLPALLHPDPETALVIGFGTGQTAHALRDEGPTRVDIAEINPAVVSMAHLFESNQRVVEDQNVHVHVMDGRAWLRRTDRLYDAVAIEPMPPHFAGSNALYSREFYALVRERLDRGGVVAQWLPFHLLPPRFAIAVAATFVEAFPDAILWIDPGTWTGILLGRAVKDAASLGSVWPGLERDGIRSLPADRIRDGVGLEPDELARYVQGAEIITDDNQWLAYGLLRHVAGEDRWHERRAEMRRANLNRVRHFGSRKPLVEHPRR